MPYFAAIPCGAASLWCAWQANLAAGGELDPQAKQMVAAGMVASGVALVIGLLILTFVALYFGLIFFSVGMSAFAGS